MNQTAALSAPVARPLSRPPRLPVRSAPRGLALAWFACRLRAIFGPGVVLDLLPDQSVRVRLKGVTIPFATLDDLLDTVT